MFDFKITDEGHFTLSIMTIGDTVTKNFICHRCGFREPYTSHEQECGFCKTFKVAKNEYAPGGMSPFPKEKK